jgi:hypothetical protein
MKEEKKKKDSKEPGRKWDGHSRPPTSLYRKNYDEIFKKREPIHEPKRDRSSDQSCN